MGGARVIRGRKRQVREGKNEWHLVGGGGNNVVRVSWGGRKLKVIFNSKRHRARKRSRRSPFRRKGSDLKKILHEVRGRPQMTRQAGQQ